MNENGDILLAIDTSGPRLQLALSVDGRVDAVVEDIAKGHAEIIFERMAALLAQNKLDYPDLTRIAVTTGPGSFTGLRIGLSAARGLGLGLDIPVVGIPTLLTMSLSAPANQPVFVLVDARRDEAYVQYFSAPGVATGDPLISPMSDAGALCPSGSTLLEANSADIALLAQFALYVRPELFPANPAYVRAADAKPQTKGKVARLSELVK